MAEARATRLRLNHTSRGYCRKWKTVKCKVKRCLALEASGVEPVEPPPTPNECDVDSRLSPVEISGNPPGPPPAPAKSNGFCNPPDPPVGNDPPSSAQKNPKKVPSQKKKAASCLEEDSDDDTDGIVTDDEEPDPISVKEHGDDLIGKMFWETDPPCWCKIVGKACDSYGNRFLRYELEGFIETSSVPEARQWHEDSPPFP